MQFKPGDLPGTDEQPNEDAPVLKPAGPGGGGQAPMPVYLKQIMARPNSIFGETTPLTDRVAMVNQVADIAREDANTMAHGCDQSA